MDSDGQSVPVYVALTGGVTTNRNDAKTNAAGDLIFALGATTDVSKAETETLGGDRGDVAVVYVDRRDPSSSTTDPTLATTPRAGDRISFESDSS